MSTVYELRQREDRNTQLLAQVKVLPGPGAEDNFTLACRLAEVLSTSDIYRCQDGQEPEYVVTSCGGDPYWYPVGGSMHQIGSAGFCLTCLIPDPDFSEPQRGLVRHPVTPQEVADGRPAFRCFVCGESMDSGRDEHLNVDHIVIWGEETHPRCEYCDGGYQTATPAGIGYVEHDADCIAITEAGTDG